MLRSKGWVDVGLDWGMNGCDGVGGWEVLWLGVGGTRGKHLTIKISLRYENRLTGWQKVNLLFIAPARNIFKNSVIIRVSWLGGGVVIVKVVII